MPCHHLRNYSTTGSTWSVASCAARNHLYVPSLGDLARLCRTASHEKCPRYLSRGRACLPVHTFPLVFTEAPGVPAW